MRIRPETINDFREIHTVNSAAFGRAGEGDLVDDLRAATSPTVSLVAEADGRIVGHIFFAPVTLTENASGAGVKIMGLAPMAVLPAHQRKGIGGRLIEAGLDRCRELGFDAVVVLGHPTYYPRFGFERASRFSIRCQYDVPDEAYMAIELRPGSLRGAAGKIEYHAAFNKL